MLFEDFALREKTFHFDHERIPERVVHARGSASIGNSNARSSPKRPPAMLLNTR